MARNHTATNLPHTLIVGAGLAGLVAADTLSRAGRDVLVLEARGVPGGRVRTLRREFDDGLLAEAGATRIPSTHLRTLELVRRCGLGLLPFRRDPLRVFAGGRLVRADDDAGIATAFGFSEGDRRLGPSGVRQRLASVVRDALGDPRDPSWPDPSLRALDAMSGADLVRSWGLSSAVTAWLDMGGASLGQHGSALHLLRELALNESSDAQRIAGGNDLLPAVLAAQLGDRVCCNAAVRRIEHDAEGVRLSVEELAPEGSASDLSVPRGALREIAGRDVIITIPFTVLRHIEITPALTDATMRAIRELHYSSVCRLFVQTRDRPWAHDRQRGFVATDEGFDIFDSSDGLPGPRGLLTIYLRDGAARRTMALGPAERREHVLSLLERIFPGVAASAERVAYWSWDDDPWARGALADFLPGQVSDLYPPMRRAEGGVHFAGEHTSPWAGSMEGAVESGVRVATDVLQS